MIKSNIKKCRIRTDVESLFLKEMVQEDANFLIMGNGDDDIIPENVDSGLFDDSSSLTDLSSDDDEYLNAILGEEDKCDECSD